MRTVIATSGQVSPAVVAEAVEAAAVVISELLSRGSGPAEHWAQGQGIPVELYTAQQQREPAGAERANQMAEDAEVCIVIGATLDAEMRKLVQAMERQGKRVVVHLA